MNRRSALIGAGLILANTTAGCLSNNDTTSDENDGADSHNCPERGSLTITFVPEVPDNEPVVDAEEEQFTDVEYLAKALSEANDKYYELYDEEINESKRLAEFRGEEVANNSGEITSKIEYGGGNYVEYKDVVYSISYFAIVC